MASYFWIAIGSALGGMARYWCSGIAARLIGETFPWGTIIVNIVGSLSSAYSPRSPAPTAASLPIRSPANSS